MTTQLTFNSRILETIEHDGNFWFTAATLATALEYTRTDSVTRIYDRNKDEFTPCMSLNVNLTVSGKINGLQHKRVRIFSLRGAHLIAMFANTPVAKQFRRWVLDLIEQKNEAQIQFVHHPRRATESLSSTDTQNLKYLIQQMTGCFKFQRSWNNAVWYALRRATGVSSPEPFSVDDLPILTKECRRIIEITGLLSEHFRRCEKETIRRIVKNREDCDIVIRELQREWQSSRISTSALRQLEFHERRALGKFENRMAI